LKKRFDYFCPQGFLLGITGTICHLPNTASWVWRWQKGGKQIAQPKL